MLTILCHFHSFNIINFRYKFMRLQISLYFISICNFPLVKWKLWCDSFSFTKCKCEMLGLLGKYFSWHPPLPAKVPWFSLCFYQRLMQAGRPDTSGVFCRLRVQISVSLHIRYWESVSHLENKDTISIHLQHLNEMLYADHTAGFSVSHFPPWLPSIPAWQTLQTALPLMFQTELLTSFLSCPVPA